MNKLLILLFPLITAQRTFATALPSKQSEKDYYTILDLESHATPEQIKAAYRSLAKKHHPDVISGSADGHEPDVEKFRNVVEAY